MLTIHISDWTDPSKLTTLFQRRDKQVQLTSKGYYVLNIVLSHGRHIGSEIFSITLLRMVKLQEKTVFILIEACHKLIRSITIHWSRPSQWRTVNLGGGQRLVYDKYCKRLSHEKSRAFMRVNCMKIVFFFVITIIIIKIFRSW